jgi:hypothetical protein
MAQPRCYVVAGHLDSPDAKDGSALWLTLRMEPSQGVITELSPTRGRPLNYVQYQSTFLSTPPQRTWSWNVLLFL